MPSVDLRPTMLILDDLPQSCKDILSEGGIQLEFLDAHKASYAEIQLRMSYCNLIAIRTFARRPRSSRTCSATGPPPACMQSPAMRPALPRL